MKHQQIGAVLGAAAALAVAVLAVAACAGPAGPSGPAVTVTVTPTVTAGPRAATTAPATPTAPAGPTSDVVGRDFDFGTITGLDTVAGTAVLRLDRWTYKGLSDAELAADGVPLTAFEGTPFLNQNDRLAYAIPVAETARILYHHCAAPGDPLQSRSATITEMAQLLPPEHLVLVRLDEQGRAVALDNLPGCPR